MSPEDDPSRHPSEQRDVEVLQHLQDLLSKAVTKGAEHRKAYIWNPDGGSQAARELRDSLSELYRTRSAWLMEVRAAL